MRVTVNGHERETAARTLADLLETERYLAETVATAVNGEFVPRENRSAVPLVDGDAVEVVSPRQGG